MDSNKLISLPPEHHANRQTCTILTILGAVLCVLVISFDGWILWLRGSEEHTSLWNRPSDGGIINDSLAPVNRPDLCERSNSRIQFIIPVYAAIRPSSIHFLSFCLKRLCSASSHADCCQFDPRSSNKDNHATHAYIQTHSHPYHRHGSATWHQPG